MMDTICKLKDIYKALYNFEKEFASQNNITINEAMVLCCLKDGSCKTANELCNFIGLSNSRVSKILLSVEDKGYISRAIGKEDKRQMFFALTAEGKKKTQIMMKQELSIEQIIKNIFQHE